MVNMHPYNTVKTRIDTLAHRCGRNPQDIKLVAVSKSCSVDDIQAAYDAGCRDFGESRIQEALEKQPHLPIDIHWHLIGTLQKNKVNKAVESFGLIHSVDSVVLAQKTSEESQRRGVTTSILLQVNVSGEVSKHGLSPSEWREALERVNSLPFLEVRGLMTMAPFVEDEEIVRSCFHQLFQLRDEFKQRVVQPALFTELSMGMSHDYPIAIEEGATILRIGTAIFAQ